MNLKVVESDIEQPMLVIDPEIKEALKVIGWDKTDFRLAVSVQGVTSSLCDMLRQKFIDMHYEESVLSNQEQFSYALLFREATTLDNMKPFMSE